MLLTLLYFFLALVLLILVHEFGHFIVARGCGVKVLRFSFGFGKVLARWHDKHGTEYAWSLLPLGGYVKLLDETEEAVPEAERHLAFNHQSLWVRFAVVLAGPLFNFLFAFVMLWLVLVIGIQSLAPMIAQVESGSIAANAGLRAKQEIVQINDRMINSWHDFQYEMMPLLGSSQPVAMTVQSFNGNERRTLLLRLNEVMFDANKSDVLSLLGIVPFVPIIPAKVGDVIADSPAQQVGFQYNDQLLIVNGHKITDWVMLVDYVKRHPNQSMIFQILRQGKPLQLQVVTKQMMGQGQQPVGYLGIRSQPVKWPAHWLRTKREAPLPALKTAWHQTLELTGSTFVLMGRLITGQLSLKAISGPIGIAKGAGESAKGGLAYYLSFLALVSISLGVLNLLPIPMLDGGHLFFYVIEIMMRRPLSSTFKSTGMYLGLVFLITLMFIALRNDLTRLTHM